MDVRRAEPADLPQLKAMYQKIVAHMDREGIRIWDAVYPAVCFPEDIARQRLYVCTEHREIAAAAALCASGGEEGLKWSGGRALYLNRLGVCVDFLHRGVGTFLLKNAADLAKKQNAEYLRLLVVDGNYPAVRLYQKNGYTRVPGIREEPAADRILYEYGFEKKIEKDKPDGEK